MSGMGIFGGTFDPIHFGHLRTSFEVLQALQFSEVRFMPCGTPPHRGGTIASPEQRLAMVRAATEGQDGFVVDDRELHREGPSYSVDTLSALRSEFPLRPIALIIGMDAFLGLPKWYHWQEILQLAHIVVAHRPGWKAPDIGTLGELLAERGTHRVSDLHQATSGHIYILDVTQLEIASTDIREIVSAGRDPRFLLPDAVREYIQSSGCYATAADSD